MKSATRDTFLANWSCFSQVQKICGVMLQKCKMHVHVSFAGVALSLACVPEVRKDKARQSCFDSDCSDQTAFTRAKLSWRSRQLGACYIPDTFNSGLNISRDIISWVCPITCNSRYRRLLAISVTIIMHCYNRMDHAIPNIYISMAFGTL